MGNQYRQHTDNDHNSDRWLKQPNARTAGSNDTPGKRATTAITSTGATTRELAGAGDTDSDC